MGVRRVGFTLVELLIAIIIIAVLAAIAIPKFSNSALRSRESAARQDLRAIRASADRHLADTGLWPVSIAAFVSTTKPPRGKYWNGTAWVQTAMPNTWDGPYIDKFPDCPIPGFEYVDYETPDHRLNVQIRPIAAAASNPYRFW